MSGQKYETLTLGQALDAVANGEQVEWSGCGAKWNPFVKVSYWNAMQSHEFTFRRAIPKKKKLVPFTQETWPIGAWVKYNGTVYFVVVVYNGYAFLPSIGLVAYSKLLHDAKLLVIENGRVVGKKPCGI